MSSIYSSLVQAKSGEPVPCFSSGATLYSRYAPLRECEAFAAQQCFSTAGFFVIGGIGNGLHLMALQKAYPEARIIAVEANQETLSFLYQQQILPPKNEKLTFTTIDHLEQTIVGTYLPALYGNFTFQSLRSWDTALSAEQKQQLNDAVSQSITAVGRDYGVQAHFGKLWNRNILQNFRLWCQLASSGKPLWWKDLSRQLKDTGYEKGLILAAGPTLDDTLDSLNPSQLPDTYIIAVDTALPAMIKRGIAPHMVVSIDPQTASLRHFLLPEAANSLLQHTILATDLCSPSGIARTWHEKGRSILFFNENHPLGLSCSSFISSDNPPFLNISAGAGTVTHSAVELAYALGFSTVSLLGADFGFPGNRPYARGTYLEDSYLQHMSRITPLEQQYDALMYRTPLESDDVHHYKTTTVLQSYREALETRYAALQKTGATHSDNGYTNPPQTTSETFATFCQKYLSDLEKMDEKALFSVLPFIAHLKSKGQISDTLDRELITTIVRNQLR